MSSSEPRYTPAQRRVMLELAREAIEYGLAHDRPRRLDPAGLPPVLQEPAASFVTLNRRDQLRGCIGSLEAHRPLGVDIAENAYAAAFRDPRFLPLAASELEDLDVHLSILSPTEPMHFLDEADLLAQLRPGVDGLVLESGPHRGTFLPAVWESLPSAEAFLAHLKQKAGLPPDFWSENLRIGRYTTESFGLQDIADHA